MATTVFYNLFKKAQLDASSTSTPVDFDTDTLNVALVTVSYVPNAATDQYWSDANTNEVTGTGYTAGGETIANMSVTETGGTVTVDGDDITWAQNAAGFNNARYAIIYKDTGNPATSPLIGYIDLTSARSSQGGDFSLQWNANGIFTLS